ncbi:MAG: hypothetical protein WC308_00195 [archaeon]|jgi:hypothetical protein
MKINYDELRRIHRLEKNTSRLVEVDADFFDSVSEFVEGQKKSYLASLKNFSPSDAREFANLKKVVEEIFLLREKKILNKALIVSRTEDFSEEKMASQEKDAFKKLLKVLEEHNKVCTGLFGEVIEKDSEKVALKMLKDVPTFIGTDMREYGPFSKDEFVEIPKKIAQLFLSRKLAEEK